jgi:SAM-dependent methyltransferase
MVNRHEDLPISPWVIRFADLVIDGGRVLDIAAGRGRHTRLFLKKACRVTAVDRNTEPLQSLASDPKLELVAADLEDGSLWPFGVRRFDAVVVTNYLHRPLFPFLLDALAPGGLLIYETFAVGNGRFGKPSNPDFLLQPGELLKIVAPKRLRVLAYEDLEVTEPKPAMVQRIVARSA